MGSGPTVVRFSFGDLERPVLVVEQQGHDTVIRIRPWGDEHLTLHRDEDGNTLLTHRSSRKPPGVWDERRVEAARKSGYAHPERHGDYYQHQTLRRASNVEGYYLVGKRIDIAAASAKAKYDRMPFVVVQARSQVVFVGIWLATAGQSLHGDEPRVTTPFGDLYFRLTDV